MKKCEHYRSGQLDRQLDPKGRFSLPVDWRPVHGESVYFVKVRVEEIPALRVFTQTAFDRKLSDIETTTDATPAQRDRARGILFGSAIESKVNDQGKLTIPNFYEIHALAVNRAPVNRKGKSSLRIKLAVQLT